MDDFYDEMNVLLSQLRPLMAACTRFQEGVCSPPLNINDLTEAEKAFYAPLPQSVKTWLSLSNGLGGALMDDIYGLHDMMYVADIHPNWVEKGWIHIASDGCGDYIVVVPQNDKPESQWPVVFIDSGREDVAGDTEITYIISSCVSIFYREELRKGIRDYKLHNDSTMTDDDLEDKYESPWYFDADTATTIDPAITTYHLPLPWEA